MNARLHRTVGSEDAVSQVALGRRAGTYRRACASKHCDLIGVNMNCVHCSEIRAEKPFSIEKLYWVKPVFAQARRVFCDLFGDVHMQGPLIFSAPSGDLYQVRQRHSANAMRRNAKLHLGRWCRALANECAHVFEKSIGGFKKACLA